MIDTETASIDHLTNPFIGRHVATGGPHTDVHLGAVCGPDIDYQNGDDMWDEFMAGIGTESPGEAASETSAPGVLVDGSVGTICTQMSRDRYKELVSSFPSFDA